MMSPNSHVARAYLSLGSNLGNRSRQLGDARAALIGTDGVRIVSCSAVVETDPVDVLDQPKFLNQVMGVDTVLKPEDLLRVCLEIEQEMGRDRSLVPRGGPRIIDLDILLYDGRDVKAPGLTIPHPRLSERRFALDLCKQAGAPGEWVKGTECT